MRKLFDWLFQQPDQSQDWTIVRMRAILDRPIGPRYPTGMFIIHNPGGRSE